MSPGERSQFQVLHTRSLYGPGHLVVVALMMLVALTVSIVGVRPAGADARTTPAAVAIFNCDSVNASARTALDERPPIDGLCRGPAASSTAEIGAVGHLYGPTLLTGTLIVTNSVDDAARIGDDLAGVGCSFSGTTLVLMADGSRKPIGRVEIGDEVLATNLDTGETAAREVTHLWVHQDTLIDLIVDGDVIATTEDHPFWNETDQEWQRADQLDKGEMVRAFDGQLLSVGGISDSNPRLTIAYNLTVDDIHTFSSERERTLFSCTTRVVRCQPRLSARRRG